MRMLRNFFESVCVHNYNHINFLLFVYVTPLRNVVSGDVRVHSSESFIRGTLIRFALSESRASTRRRRTTRYYSSVWEPETEGRQPRRRRRQQQRRQPRRAVAPQPPPEVHQPRLLPAPRPQRKNPAVAVHLPTRERARSRPSRTAEVCVCGVRLGIYKHTTARKDVCVACANRRRDRRVWWVRVHLDPEKGEADVSETRLEHRPRRVAHVLLAVCVRACVCTRLYAVWRGAQG